MDDKRIIELYGRFFRVNRIEVGRRFGLQPINSYVYHNKGIPLDIRRQMIYNIYSKVNDMESTRCFAEWLNSYMVLNGLNYQQMADKINVSTVTLNSYLAKIYEPDRYQQAFIASKLGVNTLQFNFGMIGRERVNITDEDYDLIHRLENEYGALRYVPNEDERLRTLQDKFSIMFVN